MSIQGSFNSMLSSLVFATGQVRQARAQERTAKALEGKDAEKLELAKARLAVSQQNADTAAAHEASIAQQLEAKANLIQSEADVNTANAKMINEERLGQKQKRLAQRYVITDKSLRKAKKDKSEIEQETQDSYLQRKDEIDNGRNAVGNLKASIGGKRNG